MRSTITSIMTGTSRSVCQRGLLALLTSFILLTRANSQSVSQPDKEVLHIPVMASERPGKKGFVGLSIAISVLPKARIDRDSGSYTLRSRIEPAFEFGLAYRRLLAKNWALGTGISGILAKWGYYANIPNADVSKYQLDGRSLIWDKEIWGCLSVPLYFDRRVGFSPRNSWWLRAGLNLRYSGFVQDLVTSGAIIDSNSNVVEIFDAEFSFDNGQRPWLMWILGASRQISLGNDNDLLIAFQVDLSSRHFLQGKYAIRIPDQPVTGGTYRISGSAARLSITYSFTYRNNRKAREIMRQKGF